MSETSEDPATADAPSPVLPGALKAYVDLRVFFAPIDPSVDDPEASSEFKELTKLRETAADKMRKIEEPGTTDRNSVESLLDSARQSYADLIAQAPAFLTQVGKHSKVMAHLIEALTVCHGLVGLGVGCRLAAGVIERCWDDLYPVPGPAKLEGLSDHDKAAEVAEKRCLPICQLFLSRGRFGGNRLADHIKRMAFPTGGTGTQTVAFLLDTNVATIEVIRTCLDEISSEARRAYVQSAIEAVEAIDALHEATSRQDGDTGFTKGLVIGPINAIINAVGATFPEDIPGYEAPNNAGAESATGISGPSGGVLTAPTSPNGRTRESALNEILHLAEFFARAEPQSPTATALRETVRRARLSFEELFFELLPNSDEREEFLKRAGMYQPPKGD